MRCFIAQRLPIDLKTVAVTSALVEEVRKVRYSYIGNIFYESGYTIIQIAQEMCVGGGKRRLVPVVHYSRTHNSNNI